MASTTELIIQVKVTPKAKSNQIVGWEADVLKIRVTAAPEKGQANRAVTQLLAQTLHIPQKNVTLLRGSTSRLKQFSLSGVTKEQLHAAHPQK